MNKTRRKQLAAALDQLRAIRDQVKDICAAEDEALENMGSRQGGQKGEESRAAIDEMEVALKAIKKAGIAIKAAMVE
ncbi:hypothetical protein MRBLMS1_000381 [Massilia sp. LMS1-1-1.1]